MSTVEHQPPVFTHERVKTLTRTPTPERQFEQGSLKSRDVKKFNGAHSLPLRSPSPINKVPSPISADSQPLQANREIKTINEEEEASEGEGSTNRSVKEDDNDSCERRTPTSIRISNAFSNAPIGDNEKLKKTRTKSMPTLSRSQSNSEVITSNLVDGGSNIVPLQQCIKSCDRLFSLMTVPQFKRAGFRKSSEKIAKALLSKHRVDIEELLKDAEKNNYSVFVVMKTFVDFFAKHAKEQGFSNVDKENQLKGLSIVKHIFKETAPKSDYGTFLDASVARWGKKPKEAFFQLSKMESLIAKLDKKLQAIEEIDPSNNAKCVEEIILEIKDILNDYGYSAPDQSNKTEASEILHRILKEKIKTSQVDIRAKYKTLLFFNMFFRGITYEKLHNCISKNPGYYSTLPDKTPNGFEKFMISGSKISKEILKSKLEKEIPPIMRLESSLEGAEFVLKTSELIALYKTFSDNRFQGKQVKQETYKQEYKDRFGKTTSKIETSTTEILDQDKDESPEYLNILYSKVKDEQTKIAGHFTRIEDRSIQSFVEYWRLQKEIFIITTLTHEYHFYSSETIDKFRRNKTFFSNGYKVEVFADSYEIYLFMRKYELIKGFPKLKEYVAHMVRSSGGNGKKIDTDFNQLADKVTNRTYEVLGLIHHDKIYSTLVEVFEKLKDIKSTIETDPETSHTSEKIRQLIDSLKAKKARMEIDFPDGIVRELLDHEMEKFIKWVEKEIQGLHDTQQLEYSIANNRMSTQKLEDEQNVKSGKLDPLAKVRMAELEINFEQAKKKDKILEKIANKLEILASLIEEHRIVEGINKDKIEENNKLLKLEHQILIIMSRQIAQEFDKIVLEKSNNRDSIFTHANFRECEKLMLIKQAELEKELVSLHAQWCKLKEKPADIEL